MTMRYLDDLRFIIGIFFAIVGVILLGTGFLSADQSAEGTHLNLVSGGVMFALAALMLALSIGSTPKD